MISENFTTATVLPEAARNMANVSFSWYDYILFSVMLALSALIGVYFGCFGTKQSSAGEYLMGGRTMKVFPISVSLVASHVSGITLLAVPADIYKFGATWWLGTLSLVIVGLATAYVYLPVFYKLQVISTYEYLEHRFDKSLRLLASFLFTLGIFSYMPIVVYIPALAFSTASGVDVQYITPIVCGVCIFYTTIGGLKAVVWTDTVQFIITTGAILTVGVIGLKAGGGLGTVWTTAVEGHRLDLFDFDPNPTKRDTFWAVVSGCTVSWLAWCAVDQSFVQKFLSLPSFEDAKKAVFYFCGGYILIASFSTLTGLLMYARYAKCDPFTTGHIQKSDQLLPYYIIDMASHIPGLSGLFIAGTFCAALSTLSANLNCLSGTIFADFVVKFTGPITKEKTKTRILKVIVVVTGVACTALVYVVKQLGGLLPLCLSLAGATYGPLLGMFTLGVLFPKASSKGTFYGSVFGLLFSSWIVAMTQYYKAQGIIVEVPKPLSIEGCSTNTSFWSTNITQESLVSSSPGNLEEYKPFILFRLSFYYCMPLGTISTIFFGLMFSYILTNEDPPVRKDLLSPVIYSFLPEEKYLEQNAKGLWKLDQTTNLVSINSEKENVEPLKT